MREKIAEAQSLDGSDLDDLWSILRRSVDSLAAPEREMFLDVATCFHGREIEYAKLTWKFMSGRSAESGWQNLVDRCLAKAESNGFDDIISMHELLRDLGKSIARIGQVGNSPIHTRLDNVQIANQLSSAERSTVQVLTFPDMVYVWEMVNRGRSDHEYLDMRVLHEFRDLKALWLDEGGECDKLPELLTNGCIFPVQLTFLQIFCAGRVAMSGICRIRGLRCLVLRCVMQELPPSLGDLVHLECLKVWECDIEAFPGEIGKLRSLQHLEIFLCERLKIIPEEIGQLRSLQHLVISQCYRLKIIPAEIGELRSLLHLKIFLCDRLKIIPAEIGQLRRLRHFEIAQCSSLESLPSSMGQLEALQKLEIEECRSLKVSWSLLDELYKLRRPNIRVDCIVEEGYYLLRVADRRRRWVYLLTSTPYKVYGEEWFSMTSTSSIGRYVHFWDCGKKTPIYVEGLENVSGALIEHQQLRMDCLFVGFIVGDLDWFSTSFSADHFHTLRTLEIVRCRQVAKLPGFGPQLSKLRQLRIHRLPLLESLLDLSQLEDLRVLKLSDLPLVEQLPESIGDLRMLESLQLQDLWSFSGLPESIGHLQALTVMELMNLPRLKRLPESLRELMALRDLRIHRCGWLRTATDTAFNWGPRCLETLTLDLRDGNQSLYTRKCINLGIYKAKSSQDLSYFPEQVKSTMATVEVLEAATVHEKFPRLKCVALTLMMQDLELFVDVGRRLAHLERLKIVDRGGPCRLTKLPECCGQFGSLKVLKILGCRALVHLPESLGQLSALEQLEIEKCDALLVLPESCGLLGSLKVLNIWGCLKLAKLPKSLGQLSALEQLHIRRCPRLIKLPKSCRQLGSLKLLEIWDCDTLVELPEWVGQLPALEHLAIFYCEKLTRLKGSVGQVRPLQRLTISPSTCQDLAQILHSLVVVERGSLKRLTICNFPAYNELQLPASLSQLLLCEHLDLVACRDLKALPQSIGQLHGLRCLEIKNCWDLKELPESIGQLGLLKRVAIKGCDQMGNLGNCVGWLGALEELEVDRSTLAKLAGHLGQLGSLKRLAVESFASDYEGELPESLGQLSALEELAIRNNESNWPHFNYRIPYLKRVIRKLPESIGQLLALKRLEISNFAEITQLPATVGYLSRLYKVVVRHCPKLEAWRPSSQHLQHVQELELTYEDPDGHAPKFTYFDKESSYPYIDDDEEILAAEESSDDEESADDEEILDDRGIPDDGHLRNKIFTTTLTRQDLLATVGEGRSLLEAAVIIERAKNS